MSVSPGSEPVPESAERTDMTRQFARFSPARSLRQVEAIRGLLASFALPGCQDCPPIVIEALAGIYTTEAEGDTDGK